MENLIIMSPLSTRIRVCDIRTFPCYYIHLLLISVGHLVTGSVLQQNVVFSELIHKSGKSTNMLQTTRSYRDAKLTN